MENLKEYQTKIAEILAEAQHDLSMKKYCTCIHNSELLEKGIIAVCDYHMLIFSLDEALLDLKSIMEKNNIEDDDINW